MFIVQKICIDKRNNNYDTEVFFKREIEFA